MYRNKFFKTRKQAEKFSKKRGYGVIYNCEKFSHTKQQYATECMVIGISYAEQCDRYPFVVAWNE